MLDTEILDALNFLKNEVIGIKEEMATKSELAAIKEEMATKSELAALKGEMSTKSELAALKEEMSTKSELAALKEEMNTRFATVDERLESLQHICSNIEHEHGKKLSAILDYIYEDMEKHEQYEKNLVEINKKLENHDLTIFVSI